MLSVSQPQEPVQPTNIASNLVVLWLILAAYAGCLGCNIKFTGNLSQFLGLTMVFLPWGAIALAATSKMNLAHKLLSSVAFIGLSFLILLESCFSPVRGGYAPISSERIDERNDVVGYCGYAPSLFSGGDFDVGRPSCVQVVQEQHIFPGVTRQFLLLEECSRDSVQISSFGNHQISCFFPPCYYIGHDSPDDSHPLRRVLRLRD